MSPFAFFASCAFLFPPVVSRHTPCLFFSAVGWRSSVYATHYNHDHPHLTTFFNISVVDSTLVHEEVPESLNAKAITDFARNASNGQKDILSRVWLRKIVENTLSINPPTPPHYRWQEPRPLLFCSCCVSDSDADLYMMNIIAAAMHTNYVNPLSSGDEFIVLTDPQQHPALPPLFICRCGLHASVPLPELAMAEGVVKQQILSRHATTFAQQVFLKVC